LCCWDAAYTHLDIIGVILPPQTCIRTLRIFATVARVKWILPVPLLLLAGAVALLPLAALVRRPTSVPRLMAEAFVTALVVIALVCLARVALWLLEQRW
jgi:hypothetical protein